MKIAYVDDNAQDRGMICALANKFNESSEIKVQLSTFSNPYEFLSRYDFSFDILILDIEMLPMNGIQLAAEIRKMDSTVVILYLTNMAQYAIDGYSVGAVDYLLKPVRFFEFKMKLTRAFRFVNKDRDTRYIIHTSDGTVALELGEILYIEVTRNNCLYHTERGTFGVRNTLKEIEERLKGHDFFRMNHCYLVNMKFVDEIRGGEAIVKGEKLPISRNRKKAFTDAQLRYWTGERNFI